MKNNSCFFFFSLKFWGVVCLVIDVLGPRRCARWLLFLALALALLLCHCSRLSSAVVGWSTGRSAAVRCRSIIAIRMLSFRVVRGTLHDFPELDGELDEVELVDFGDRGGAVEVGVLFFISLRVRFLMLVCCGHSDSHKANTSVLILYPRPRSSTTLVSTRQIGKKLVEALDEVAKVKGFEGTMKKRHPGLEWIGIDKGSLTQDCDYVEKMGWVATPDSCHGAANLANMAKGLSAELLPSHLPCDYYLGEIIVPEHEKTKYQAILDGKLRVLLTLHHCIHVTKTLSYCSHARTLARSHARTLAHTQVCMRRVEIDTTPEDNIDDGSQATAAEDFI